MCTFTLHFDSAHTWLVFPSLCVYSFSIVFLQEIIRFFWSFFQCVMGWINLWLLLGRKQTLSVSKLSILWLLLCLKCPVIWSYHSLALALSHWKIDKLLVAYPPLLPRHPCPPLLSECHHHDLHDHPFAVVILIDHLDALSLCQYLEV